MSAAIGRLFLRALGWRIVGAPPELPKLVVVIAPHTSTWDFPIAVAVMLALRLDAAFLGKHTLFRGPLGWLMRRLGGIPVDRRVREDRVATLVGELEGRESMVLALAPEGTRTAVDEWKTGFYYIAQGAGVPIVPVALDYACREVRFGVPLEATGELEGDLAQLKSFYDGVTGRHPRQAQSPAPP